MERIVAIGGGAAGFFGAIACAASGARVTLLEASRQPLSKVLVSGGGRCNVTHACFEPAVLAQNYPRGSKALLGAFARFQPRDTVQWFEGRGVRLKTEADGRMFPTSDRSETIARCLLDEAEAVGVELRLRSPAISLDERGDGFTVGLKSGETLTADRVLVATGSHPCGHRWAAALGHAIAPPVPSLFTFQIPDTHLRSLAGVAVEPATVSLPDAKLEQTGAVLVTHWGLSGPAVLKLSAWGARALHDRGYQTLLRVNWLPQYDRETLRAKLQAVREEMPRKAIAAWCPFGLPKRLWQSLLDRAAVSEDRRWANLSKKQLHRLSEELTRSEFQVRGKGIYKEEFVTCGGVSLKEVRFKTMESRICKGLYFAGEILDIDGVTGGFNFQSAWTTGWIAGRSMAA